MPPPRTGTPKKALLPLPMVRRDEEATVELLAATGPIRARLEELGFVPGARVRVVAEGAPCIVALRGETKLCLRGEEADSILVQVA